MPFRQQKSAKKGIATLRWDDGRSPDREMTRVCQWFFNRYKQFLGP